MTSPLAKKLLIKPGQRMRLINAPAGYAERLAPLPEGSVLVEEGRDLDFVQFFVTDRAELKATLPAVIESLKYDGLCWVTYPKRASKVPTDLTRDVIWAMLREDGLATISNISIDDIWSALRIRPEAEVKRKPDSTMA